MLKNEFHIWDLPIDRIYIRLNPDFQKHLFLDAKNICKTWKNFAKIIGCCTVSLLNWKNNKTSVPFEIIIKISEICKVPLSDVESKLVSIQTGKSFKSHGSVGKPLLNPKFPLALTPELAKVLARFMGDGCIKINWYYEASYNNINDILIKEMKNDVIKAFGECDIFEGLDKRGKTIKFLNFPPIIGMIVVHMFGDVSTTKARVPDQIFSASDVIKTAFLQAYFDDEGTVDTKQAMARYYTTNSETAKGLMSLLNDVGIKGRIHSNDYISKKGKKNTMYKVDITSRENVLKFFKKVSPLHPSKRGKLQNTLKIEA